MTKLSGILKTFKTIDKLNEYKDIFREMLKKESPESKLFWQLDKLDLVVQALQYEKEYGKKLDEFFVNAGIQIFSPFLKKLFKEVIKRRPKLK